MTIYTLEPGRILAADGEPVLKLANVWPDMMANTLQCSDPADADALAHRIVALLNDAERRDGR